MGNLGEMWGIIGNFPGIMGNLGDSKGLWLM